MGIGLDFILPLVLLAEDVVLAGGPEVFIPLILGGMGAAGSIMSGGAEGKLGGYGRRGIDDAPTRQSIDPTLLGNLFAPIEQMTGVWAGRAQQPVTLPGAFVQPTPLYSGGGMPFAIGNVSQDTSLQQPSMAALPAPDFGEGPLSDPYKPYIRPRAQDSLVPNQWGTVPQTPVRPPELYGGIPQLKGSLALLGLHSDPYGNLTYEGGDIFTGLTPTGSPGPGGGNPVPDSTCPSGKRWPNGQCAGGDERWEDPNDDYDPEGEKLA